MVSSSLISKVSVSPCTILSTKSSGTYTADHSTFQSAGRFLEMILCWASARDKLTTLHVSHRKEGWAARANPHTFLFGSIPLPSVHPHVVGLLSRSHLATFRFSLSTDCPLSNHVYKLPSQTLTCLSWQCH
jgi:hypothetical protein